MSLFILRGMCFRVYGVISGHRGEIGSQERELPCWFPFGWCAECAAWLYRVLTGRETVIVISQRAAQTEKPSP